MIAAFNLVGFRRVLVGGSKILIMRGVCSLLPWQVSSCSSRRQQNLACEASLLPLVLVSFIRVKSEAAKSCLRDEFAAFGLGEFHRVFGGGSKILIMRGDCCL